MNPVQALPQALETAFSGFALYPVGHARQESALDNLHGIIKDFIDKRIPLLINLADQTIIFNGTPLFEESAKATRFIDRLEERGVRSISFNPDITRQDLEKLFVALARPIAQGEPMSLHAQLMAVEVTAIKVLDTTVQETFRGAGGVGRHFVARMARQARDLVEGTIRRALEEVATNREVDVDKLETVTADITQMVDESKEKMLSLTNRAYHDHFTYNHSVNCCILATGVSELFLDSEEEVNLLAQAAMLHDVGKICVPEQIIYKQDKLSEEEWDAMRAHPRRGAEILMRCSRIDPLCVLLANSHHMRLDGSGYPDDVSNVAGNLFVSIMAAVDVYEAMTAQRPYKTPLSPDRAMDVLLDGAGVQFHPDVVRAMLDVLGFYPPGSTVELAGGEKGRVTETIPGAPQAAVVEICQDPHGDPLSPPRTVTIDAADCPPEHRIICCTLTEEIGESEVSCRADSST